MAKAEISWNRTNPEGERFQVYAHHVSKNWRFYIRQRRYENWQPLENPPLEDWLELLDAVRRRVARRLLTPDTEKRLEQNIRERFPETAIPD
jgi:predicted carbohydrate-binding protein with CBM5 and CBM33 domain